LANLSFLCTNHPQQRPPSIALLREKLRSAEQSLVSFDYAPCLRVAYCLPATSASLAPTEPNHVTCLAAGRRVQSWY